MNKKHITLSMADRDLLKPFFGSDFEPSAGPRPDAQLFHFVNNPDGHARWVFPVTCRAGTLLSLYNSAGWRGKLVSAAMHTAFLLKKPALVASGSFWWDAQATGAGGDFAIFTGTIGVNRKLVVSHGGLFFEKIPTSTESGWLVEHESKCLGLLRSLKLQKTIFPTEKRTVRGGILLSNVRPARSRAAAELTELHRDSLHEIAHRTGRGTRLAETIFYHKMLKSLRDYDAIAPSDFTRKMVPLHALISAELAAITPFSQLDVGLAHGDFTPWNCFLPASFPKNEPAKLSIYDWEMFLPDAPLGFDALHFTFQSGILLRRLPLEKLLDEAERTATAFSATPGLVLRLYVLFTASYYLSRYAQQPELHRQAWWLTEAWEQALRANRLPLGSGKGHFEQVAAD